jgi:hypothetical protein
MDLNIRLWFRRGAALAMLAAWGAGARPVRAEQAAAAAEAGAPPVFDSRLTLDPAMPQVGALPGGVTPAFGQRSLSEGEWRFDFHGLLTAPLNAGINSRPNPVAGQNKTVLHAPPVVPDDLETFSHTGVVPTTYAQLNFSEGNSLVTATVSLVARQANASTAFLEPASQLGITDVFLTVLPPTQRVRLQAFFGAFTLRYGATGEYDEGRYGTPLIARISGVGEHVIAKMGHGPLTFVVEEGLQGQTNKASASITPDVWNDFADPASGSTFVAHVHGAVAYTNLVTVGGHFIHAFSQDDRAGTNLPDGRIDIVAADARFGLGRHGHLYAACAHTDALQARPVSRVVSVLNTQGGRGLMDNYLGDLSGGTGKLDTVGAQYDLSVGKLVSYPVPFAGDGPDLFLSVFGMFTHVSSTDPTIDPATNKPQFDGINKMKLGLEATYSLLSWLAISGRYDRVAPNLADNDFSFAVVSPRIILRTDWQSTDQLVLQYSHWINGSLTTVRTGDPPMEDRTVIPDGDMVSLSASMWW